MNRLGFIGIGKMGGSILNGIISSKLYKIEDILLFDVNKETLETYKANNYKIANSEKDVLLNSDIVLIAIKPQSFPEFLNKCKDIDINCMIISIAAGITTSYLEETFIQAKIVRVMPNTPALIKCGASAISKNKYVSLTEFEKAKKIFESIGTVEEIKEEDMDLIVPLNGSMPAYLYLFAKSFIDEAVSKGIDEEKAKRLCANAIIGSSKMILENNKSIDQLIKDVCSPHGTTLAGLEVLQENDFEKIIKKASKACSDRSIELGKK